MAELIGPPIRGHRLVARASLFQQLSELERAVRVAAMCRAAIGGLGTIEVASLLEQNAERARAPETAEPISPPMCSHGALLIALPLEQAREAEGSSRPAGPQLFVHPNAGRGLGWFAVAIRLRLRVARCSVVRLASLLRPRRCDGGEQHTAEDRGYKEYPTQWGV